MARKKKAPSEVVDPSIALEEGDVQKTKGTYKIVKKNLRTFGLYTLEDRALCRIFDGLNPSQRRVLWTLWLLKRTSKAVPAKCATAVGKTIGEFHPHGDVGVYGSLVRLAWKRYPLVQKHGNFGNSEGLLEDPPAAMRYTETRLTEFGDRLFDDIHVMPLVKSFTDQHEEPELLPARIPLTLVNGSKGVAVGLSPSLPPHNLKEVIDACVHVVENPECSALDLTKFIKGPDYGPRSGVITSSKRELQALYVTGQGKVKYSCRYHIEKGKKSSKLVITGKPPGFSINKPTQKKDCKFVAVTKALQDKKLIEAAANDEGSLDNPVRITVEFKDWNIIKDRVLPLLQTSQSYRFYALDEENKPRRYDLKAIIDDFIEFRKAIETAVLEKEQETLQRKLGIEEAKRAAIDQIDFVVEVMKQSKKIEAAITKLCKGLKIEEWQAEVILNSQIKSLMNLNKQTVEGRIKDLKKRLKEIAADLDNINGVVIRRLKEMLKYADPRGMPIGEKHLADTEAMEAESAGFKWLAMNPNGKVERFEDLPLKSKAAWKYSSFTRAGDPVLIVVSNNTLGVESVSYLDKINLKDGKVVAAIPCSNHQVAVVLTNDGRYCALDLDNLKPGKKSQTIFRNLGKAKVVYAFGINSLDRVAVLFEEGDLRHYKIRDFKVGRPNINPRPLEKDFKGVPVLGAWALQKSDRLCSFDGEEVGSSEEVDPGSELLAVGKHNLVVLSSGKRSYVPQEGVLDLLESAGSKVDSVVKIPSKPRPKATKAKK
jgi:DNA gyrase/topoisomerase IV subunit A